MKINEVGLAREVRLIFSSLDVQVRLRQRYKKMR